VFGAIIKPGFQEVSGCRRLPHHGHDQCIKFRLTAGLSAAKIPASAVVANAFLVEPEQAAVFIEHVFGDGGLQDATGFKIDQFGITEQSGFGILRVMQLDNVQIEATESQLVECGFEAGGVEQIAEYDCDARSGASVQKLSDGFKQAGFGLTGLECFEELHEGQDAFATACQGKLFDDTGCAGEDGNAIEVSECNPGERGGELSGEVKFSSVGEVHAA